MKIETLRGLGAIVSGAALLWYARRKKKADALGEEECTTTYRPDGSGHTVCRDPKTGQVVDEYDFYEDETVRVESGPGSVLK